MEKEQLRKGARVIWKSHGGEAHGKVVRKQTAPTRIKGHQVAASEQNPQYIVETDDGKRAAHKPDALTKEYGDRIFQAKRENGRDRQDRWQAPSGKVRSGRDQGRPPPRA